MLNSINPWYVDVKLGCQQQCKGEKGLVSKHRLNNDLREPWFEALASGGVDLGLGGGRGGLRVGEQADRQHGVGRAEGRGQVRRQGPLRF